MFLSEANQWRPRSSILTPITVVVVTILLDFKLQVVVLSFHVLLLIIEKKK